jgi:hypothetical protein
MKIGKRYQNGQEAIEGGLETYILPFIIQTIQVDLKSLLFHIGIEI